MSKRKFIYTNIKEYLKESYVDNNGSLKDMNYIPSSDDLWSDKKFLSFVTSNLDNGSEMPEKLYKELSDNHKELYMKEILDYGGMIIADSDNKSLIKDLISYDYKKIEEEVLKWVEMYSTFGNDHFPFSDIFIENIDEILQGRIINKLTEVMEWDIDLPKTTFYKLHPRVRKMIEDNDFKPFNMDFD